MTLLRVVVAVVFVVALANAHSYLTKPYNRNGGWWGCRMGAVIKGEEQWCPGPCDQANYSTSQPHTQGLKRGDPLKVYWPRNNHNSGFVRLAFHKPRVGEIETHKMYDDYVHEYRCYESNCHSDRGLGLDGGDSVGGGFSEQNCNAMTNIPTWLSDGVWTMQWSWYGGSGGDHVLGDYYSCANLNISGGSALTGRSAPKFIGGDSLGYGNTSVCSTVATDRLHFCKVEPCDDYCNGTNTPLKDSTFSPGYVDAMRPHWKGNCIYPPWFVPAYIENNGGVITSNPSTTGKPKATTGKPRATTGKPRVTTGVKPVMPTTGAYPTSIIEFKWAFSEWEKQGNCIAINEPKEIPTHYWGDNYMCSLNEDISSWKWSSEGAISGMNCIAWRESTDKDGWDNNYLCIPTKDPRTYAFSASGPIAGMTCVNVNESSDPDTWNDNYWCTKINANGIVNVGEDGFYDDNNTEHDVPSLYEANAQPSTEMNGSNLLVIGAFAIIASIMFL